MQNLNVNDLKVLAISGKTFLTKNKDKLVRNLQSEQNILQGKLQKSTRDAALEVSSLQKIYAIGQQLMAIDIILRQLDQLIDKRRFIIQSNGNLQAVADLQPCISTLLFASGKLETQEYDSLCEKLAQFYQINLSDINLHGKQVDQDLKKYLNNEPATPEQLQPILIDFCQEKHVDIKIGAMNHSFMSQYIRQLEQSQRQPIQQQYPQQAMGYPQQIQTFQPQPTINFLQPQQQYVQPQPVIIQQNVMPQQLMPNYLTNNINVPYVQNQPLVKQMSNTPNSIQQPVNPQVQFQMSSNQPQIQQFQGQLMPQPILISRSSSNSNPGQQSQTFPQQAPQIINTTNTQQLNQQPYTPYTQPFQPQQPNFPSIRVYPQVQMINWQNFRTGQSQLNLPQMKK